MIERHDMTLTDLTYQLGDRYDVIQEYYAGFVMSKGMSEKLAARLG